MDDGETRALCHRFFDAIERHDLDTVRAIYAPGFRIWANVTHSEKTAEENLEILAQGRGLHRRRTYDDREVRTFPGGFLARFSINIVQHDGRRRSLWAAMVAECRDGQITRLAEYLDSSKFSDANLREKPA